MTGHALEATLTRERLKAAVRLVLTTFEPGEPTALSDMLREGLQDTPERAAKAWEYWLGGYRIDPIALIKTFEDGADGYDQMIVVTHINFFSKCEHHMADIIGRATVGYIPNKRIIGLSKLARVVDAYARRLQVQERMTKQVADAIWVGLNPVGVGVHIAARHMCMESRGVHAVGTITHTQALRGAMLEEPAARSEFLSMIDRSVKL